MKKFLALTLIGMLAFCVPAFAIPSFQLANDDGSVKVNVTADGKLETTATLSGNITVGTVDQGTGGSSAWKVTGTGGTFPVTGTFYQATQPVSIASMPSTPVTGTFWQATQPVSIADGSGVTFGAKADAKSTATDTTAVTAMQVLKQISYMEQNPASRAVTNAGAFPVDLNPPTGMGTNQKNVTTAGSREALASSTPCLTVTIKAKAGNTGSIYVGTAAGVSSTTGYILAKNETVTVDTNNLANVGLDSSVNGEGVSYIYATK